METIGETCATVNHEVHAFRHSAFGLSRQGRAQLPCHWIQPESNPDFVGRRDVLDMLDQALLPTDNTSASQKDSLEVFALCGLGGIGKTQAGIQFATSRKEAFDAIFSINAATSSRLENDSVHVAMLLGFGS